MQLLDIPTAIPEKVERLLAPVIRSVRENAAERSPDEWDHFETQLVRWEQDPGALEDEGLESPNQETIPLIREVARALCDLAVEPRCGWSPIAKPGPSLNGERRPSCGRSRWNETEV